MIYLRSVAGALAIMAASGMIADFDVYERDDALHVRVWSNAGEAESDLHRQVLHRQVVALLARRVEEGRIVVVRADRDA